MSVICHNFVQNTWKKDLCSNCFKSSSEHKHTETRNQEILNFINSGVTSPVAGSNGDILGRYMSQATTIYQSRSYLSAQNRWSSLILDQKNQNGSLCKLPTTCLTENSGKQNLQTFRSTRHLNLNGPRGEKINTNPDINNECHFVKTQEHLTNPLENGHQDAKPVINGHVSKPVVNGHRKELPMSNEIPKLNGHDKSQIIEDNDVKVGNEKKQSFVNGDGQIKSNGHVETVCYNNEMNNSENVVNKLKNGGVLENYGCKQESSLANGDLKSNGGYEKHKKQSKSNRESVKKETSSGHDCDVKKTSHSRQVTDDKKKKNPSKRESVEKLIEVENLRKESSFVNGISETESEESNCQMDEESESIYGILKAEKNKNEVVKQNVKFHREESFVIGYGGNDYDADEPSWEIESDEGDEWMFETMDSTTEERIISRMTKENTEFNSDNENLLRDPNEETHVMNVKNAISKLEGLNNGNNLRGEENQDDIRSRKTKNSKLPTLSGVKSTKSSSNDTVTLPKSANSETKQVVRAKTDDSSVKNIDTADDKQTSEDKVLSESTETNAVEKEAAVSHKENNLSPDNPSPVYSVVAKDTKSSESQCTCPVKPASEETEPKPYDSTEPHYKVPNEHTKIAVPESQIAEFLNYDVPATRGGSVGNPDADEYNVIDEDSSDHYDTVRPVSLVPEVAENSPTTSPDLDNSLETVVDPMPKPQSSFLHRSTPTKTTSANVESDKTSIYEENTTTNPIYAPTEVLQDTNNDDLTMDENCEGQQQSYRPRIPNKPGHLVTSTGTGNNSGDTQEVDSETCNIYDAVDSPKVDAQDNKGSFGRHSIDSNIYQEINSTESVNFGTGQKSKSFIRDSEVVTRQRNGSNKRQAPNPPKVQPVESKIPLPVKKSQRHSMTFSNGEPNVIHATIKPKSSSLGGYNRIRASMSPTPVHHKGGKDVKPKKGKFWKKFLNKFSKESEEGTYGRTTAAVEDRGKNLKLPNETGNKKMAKLEIIHPIDFEHSGGPQIIESPAITTGEDGLPSVIDCSTSVFNYASVEYTNEYKSSSENEASFSNESLTEEQSQEEQSDYTNSEMMSSAAKPNKPQPPTRTKSLPSYESDADDTKTASNNQQAPSRPPPPKVPPVHAQRQDIKSSSPSNDCLSAPDYSNTQELQSGECNLNPSETSQEEQPKRRAPKPPLNIDESPGYETVNDERDDAIQPTYQNINQLSSVVDEMSYYEPLEINRNSTADSYLGSDQGSSSPAGSNSLENICNSSNATNDSKSTDSGFIDYSKVHKTVSKLHKEQQQQNVGNYYEKIESDMSSARSSSPEDHPNHEVNRRRNISGLSDNAFTKGCCKRLASLTLEENYGSIVCTNHETLACILESVQRVKTSHPLSKRGGSLKWQDFELDGNEPLVRLKSNTVIFKARCKMIPDLTVTLMVSKDNMHLSPPGNAPFIIQPIMQFKDVVSEKIFDFGKVAERTDLVSASIWVMDYIDAVTIPDFVNGTDEDKIYFVVLQLITALKFLQAHGIEELDSKLENFLINRTNNHLFIIGDSTIVQSQHVQYKSNGNESKLSLCHSAMAAILFLLGKVSRTDLIAQIDEKMIDSLRESHESSFYPISTVLMKEKAVSLSQAKSLVEYMLWGPPENSFDRKDFCSCEDLEIVIQRWLDQERACFLSNVIRSANNGQPQTSVPLPIYDEYKLTFLVRTSAKTIREASIMLEPEITAF